MSNTPLVNTSGLGSLPWAMAAAQASRDSILDSKRAADMRRLYAARRRPRRASRAGRQDDPRLFAAGGLLGPVLAETVQVLHGLAGAAHQGRQDMQDAAGHFLLAGAVETDLRVEPVLQPARVGQARLHGVVGEEIFVDMQVGGVHG